MNPKRPTRDTLEGGAMMIEPDALSQLVAVYLHQDWPLEYETVWDAVDAFRREESPAVVDEARSQVFELLQYARTEEELRRVLITELGSGYWPPGDDLTFRSWLERVASELAVKS